MTRDKITGSSAPETSTASSPPSSATLAHKIGDIILDKKGTDLVVLDVEGVTTLADYLVIATGASQRQVSTMARELRTEMKKLGVACLSSEGVEAGWWVLQDFGDVIVHLMQADAREFYDLEVLWADGEVVRRSANVA